jgi:hypothetical protein
LSGTTGTDDDFRQVEMFVVNPADNEAFSIEYTPAEEVTGTSGYPEEVRQIFESFKIIC